MLCTLHEIVSGCFQPRSNEPKRVALLVEGFPRFNHPMIEFASLLLLLRNNCAKVTFVVDWCEIRSRGLTSSVAEMVRLLSRNGHELAVKFRPELCGPYDLRQHAVEALHFLQRVYGITAVSAKVGCRLAMGSSALSSLGIRIVDSLPNQRVVHDTANTLTDVQIVLDSLGTIECVRVCDI